LVRAALSSASADFRKGESVIEAPVLLRIPYEQWFVPPRCRAMRAEWFMDEGAVMVRVVDPEDAPIAYRFRPGSPSPDHDHENEYAVRIHQGNFWWPLSWGDGKFRLGPVEFKIFAAKGLPLAVAAIDPSISVPLRRWPLRLFDANSARSVGSSDKGYRWGWANSNALRVMFCGNEVLVEAGEPVFYAVPCRGGVEIDVGPSAWDRWNERRAMPGPDREQRRDCARRGLAFGVEELENELRILADRGTNARRGIQVETIRSEGSAHAAALLCARALAEFLWEEAGRHGFWTDALRQSVPALANAGEPNASPEDLRHRDVLEQIAATKNTVIVREFAREIRDARDILARWRALGITGFAAADEAAIALLAT
jgi:hypothetical protein